MHPDELRKIIQNLRIWQRGDQRAPHKPLLLLYALGRVSRGEPRKMFYDQVIGDLKNLLSEFGPPRVSHSPRYPFIRPSNDWGAFTLNNNIVFDVAENAHGTYGMEEWLKRFYGQLIRKPQGRIIISRRT